MWRQVKGLDTWCWGLAVHSHLAPRLHSCKLRRTPRSCLACHATAAEAWRV